jgi:hypothetical protein
MAGGNGEIDIRCEEEARKEGRIARMVGKKK